MIPRLLLFILLSLAACSADRLYSTPDEVPQARVAVAWDSVEVVEVTLPTYAASEAIYVREADGAIAALGPLWSDDPARATTLQLSRDLAAITGARVAPDPWPFRGFAEVRLDVRIEDFVATGPGTF